MSVESIVEAFARGLAQGFVSGTTTAQTRTGRRRSRKPSVRNDSVLPSAPSPPTQETLFDQPEVLAPPFTQAELERMEATLRGESASDTYQPGEPGVAPWQGK